MVGFRNPGSTCVTKSPSPRGEGVGGARPTSTHSYASQNRHDGLTHQEQELILDIVQFILDIVGIIEPTPFADGSNTLISLGRGEWLSAALSGLGMIPYLGDLAKLGKLPKYAHSVHVAVELAKTDLRFAEHLRPVFKKLGSVLEDLPLKHVPDQVAGTVRKIQSDVKVFLGAAAVESPIGRALSRLPESLRGGFQRALELTPMKNPRLLRKHPGPIAEDVLVKELTEKGFVQVKKGNHALASAGEDSDIYLRRIRGKDGDYFEAVRIDRKAMPENYTRASANADKSVGQIQSEAKPFRRAHHTLSETSSTAAASEGGKLKTDPQKMLDQLKEGQRKGAFSHWHLEQFEATPDKLSKYMTGPLKGTRKFDSVGQPL